MVKEKKEKKKGFPNLIKNFIHRLFSYGSSCDHSSQRFSRMNIPNGTFLCVEKSFGRGKNRILNGIFLILRIFFLSRIFFSLFLKKEKDIINDEKEKRRTRVRKCIFKKEDKKKRKERSKKRSTWRCFSLSDSLAVSS